MSVAFDIHRTIRNGHRDTVTCTFTQTGFDAVRKMNLHHKKFIYERDIKIAFSYLVRTRKTREHSDGFNDKFKKITNMHLLLSDLFVLICHYICVCDISKQVCTEDI